MEPDTDQLPEADDDDVDIPEPDYTEGTQNGTSGSPYGLPATVPANNTLGLIQPKKLHNPCLESKERQDLHRELLFNQKLGIDVLHKKSELSRKLEQRRDEQKKKEIDEHAKNKRTAFEMKLEEQANKLKNLEEPRSPSEKIEASEFLKVHSKIRRANSSS